MKFPQYNGNKTTTQFIEKLLKSLKLITSGITKVKKPIPKEIRIKSLPGYRVLYLSGVGLDNAEEAENRLYWLIRSKGFDSKENAILIYYDNPLKDLPEKINWNVCVPFNKEIKLEEDFKIMTLENERVASIIHKGSYDKINKTLNKLFKWISSNNYKISGNIREIHISNKEVEIQIPIKKSQ